MKFWEPIARRSSSVSCRSLTPGVEPEQIVKCPYSRTVLSESANDDKDPTPTVCEVMFMSFLTLMHF